MLTSVCEPKKLDKIRDETLLLLPYKSTVRSTLMFASRASKNIPIRTPLEELVIINEHTKDSVLRIFETSFKSFNSRFSQHTPILLDFLNELSLEKKQKLLRVQIVTLDPLTNIPEHIDEGYYYTLTNRYHLVIKSGGSTMEEEGVKTTYKEGDIFYLENRKLHRAYNENEHERVHVIFDTLSFSIKERFLRLYETSFLFSNRKNKTLFFIKGLWFLFLSSVALTYEN